MADRTNKTIGTVGGVAGGAVLGAKLGVGIGGIIGVNTDNKTGTE